MTQESAATLRIREARTGLLMTHPFFGVLSLKLKLVETDRIPTFGVTTSELMFNPAFADSLSMVELKAVIAHEAMHVGLCHHARCGDRDHALFNIAGDLAINPCLVDDGFTLPKGALIDPQFKGMSAEQIYEKLRDMSEKMRAAFEAAQATGTFESAGPEGSAAAGEAARQWEENTQAAVRAAQSAGKLPAHIKRTLDHAVPKADWKTLLRRFMSDQVRVRSTWSKRNKRFPDIFLPGRVRDGIGPIVVGVDTSGSISGPVLDRFAAEIRSIAEDVEPSEIHVVYCDAEVNHVESFEHGMDITLSPHGGGGTRFVPVFERVAAEGWEPVCLIYLTDLQCGEWPAEPGYPVLWASYGAGGAVAPMGETVAID